MEIHVAYRVSGLYSRKIYTMSRDNYPQIQNLRSFKKSRYINQSNNLSSMSAKRPIGLTVLIRQFLDAGGVVAEEAGPSDVHFSWLLVQILRADFLFCFRFLIAPELFTGHCCYALFCFFLFQIRL